nr:response regulator transcription factor [Halofilum ochraceum]
MTVPQGVDPVPRIRASDCFVVCFDYDYPDLPGLADLQRTRRELPSMPILMLTSGHSEAIAVWAFRSRVWDYFVHPIDHDRFQAVLHALAELMLSKAGHDTSRGPEKRRIVDAPQGFPRETRMRPHAGVPDPLPALDAVLAHIDRNLHNKILQREVAAISGLSPFQFSRSFKRHFEMTFQEYVLRRRINEAMRLLHHPGVSISDVCYNVGFRDPSYFTRTFHRYVGSTPSAYRLTARKAAQEDREALGDTPPPPENLLTVPATQTLRPFPP